MCRRPLVLFRSPLDWRGPLRLRSLFDLASGSYGVAMVALIAAFAFSDMSALRFARTLSVLLFVIGSLLLVDGALSVRTRIDRTWGVVRSGAPAAGIGGGKLASGAVAILMVCVGISL